MYLLSCLLNFSSSVHSFDAWMFTVHIGKQSFLKVAIHTFWHFTMFLTSQYFEKIAELYEENDFIEKKLCSPRCCAMGTWAWKTALPTRKETLGIFQANSKHLQNENNSLFTRYYALSLFKFGAFFPDQKVLIRAASEPIIFKWR